MDEVFVTTLAGTGLPGAADGVGAAASFNAPFALSLHAGALLVADLQNHLIRRLALDWPHNVSTVAGSGRAALKDGVGAAASFNRPAAIDNDGESLFVADRLNHAIRSVALSSSEVTTLAGSGSAGLVDGVGAAAQLNGPTGLAWSGGTLFVADQLNSALRRIDVATRHVMTLPAPKGAWQRPTGLAVRCAGAAEPGCAPWQLVVADQQHQRVALYGLADGSIATLAGGTRGARDGWGAAASFFMPTGVALRAHSALVADRNNGLLRTVGLAHGRTRTLAGSAAVATLLDGAGDAAAFQGPTGLALAADGETLYVADHYNHAIRRVTLPADAPDAAAPAPPPRAPPRLPPRPPPPRAPPPPPPPPPPHTAPPPRYARLRLGLGLGLAALALAAAAACALARSWLGLGLGLGPTARARFSPWRRLRARGWSGAPEARALAAPPEWSPRLLRPHEGGAELMSARGLREEEEGTEDELVLSACQRDERRRLEACASAGRF